LPKRKKNYIAAYIWQEL